MAENVVPEDKLKELQELQTAFSRLTTHYGELHYQRKVIVAELDQAEKAFELLEERRKTISDELQQLFGGPGTVNLQTGEFVSSS